MTTRDGGTVGPPHPDGSGMAGLSAEWVYFGPGDQIRCLATRADRRQVERGYERRAAPRPCPHRWGRVGDGMVVWLRPVSQGQPPAPGPVLHIQCGVHYCHRAYEAMVVAISRSEAA